MAQIISLSEYKAKTAERAVARYLSNVFDEPFDMGKSLSALPPKVLCFLAEPGDQSAMTLYSLIIGLSGYSETTTFESLDAVTQGHILDIHLFLSDQIRFEMMRRLGWIEGVVGNRYPLVNMVTGFARIRRMCRDQQPTLARDHVDFKIYCDLFERDRHVFIRRLMTSALKAFKKAQGLK